LGAATLPTGVKGTTDADATPDTTHDAFDPFLAYI